jgi:hypothetical protein
MTETFRPLETLRDGLRSWWLIVVFMVMGAVVGGGAWRAFHPVFESKASISVSIDFTRTGQLSDIEEDLAMVAIGDILKSTKVTQIMISQAAEKGMIISETGLRETAFLERQNELWLLRVRDENPEMAAYLANLWLDTSYSVLQEAYLHALNAETLYKYMNSLAQCLERTANIAPVQTECGTANLETLLIEMEKTNSSAQEEKLASLGIMPASVFTISERAAAASRSVRFGLGQLILAGALIGLLLAVAAIQLGWVERIWRIRNSNGQETTL